MRNKYLEFGTIPSNFDVDVVFENLNGNKTLKKNIKDGAVYLISLLTKNNYNELSFDNSYRRLNESILSDVIGRGKDDKRLITIINFLLKNNVIETTPYRIGRYSKGYRLKEEFNIGHYKWVEFSERIKKKLLENTKRIRSMTGDTQTIDFDQSYLYDQFKSNDLTVEYHAAIKFIKELGHILLKKALDITDKKNQDFTLESLLHYLGKMDNILIDLREKHYSLSISYSNRRFNSNLTSLPKILRQFLKINKEKVGEVDISSCQPYILSSILNDKFLESENGGYNIATIYPQLSDEFIKKKCVMKNDLKKGMNYLLGVSLSDINRDELMDFIKFDFRNDFYQSIIKIGNEKIPNNAQLQIVDKKGRDYVKKNMMNVFFEKNEVIRNDNPVIIILNEVFPSLSYFIENFNLLYNNRQFALLLQRTEAYLMLNNVCKNLSEKHPKIPFFTIHDSIITTVSYLTVVEEIMTETITNITGKSVNVKKKEIKESNPVEWVDEKWNKIQIKSEEKYAKMKPKFLYHNINKGIELLKTGDQTQDALIQKFYKNIS
jgi:hypothetical protein